jgi:enamine deaminase RidA (YjgF/YER057c/UK114 family)
MIPRQIFSSGAKWEAIVGYSRAVRVGPLVWISGCTAVKPEGGIAGVGDPAAQMRQAIANLERGLHKAGASLRDVVRTRVYVTNIAQWESVGRVHGEVFGHIRPASTMVEVSKLIDPAMLVEIEADAIVAHDFNG